MTVARPGNVAQLGQSCRGAPLAGHDYPTRWLSGRHLSILCALWAEAPGSGARTISDTSRNPSRWPASIRREACSRTLTSRCSARFELRVRKSRCDAADRCGPKRISRTLPPITDFHRDNMAKPVRAPNITIQVISRSIGMFSVFGRSAPTPAGSSFAVGVSSPRYR